MVPDQGVQIFVGAGGNMGDSLALLTSAYTQLAAHPEMTNARRSRWYRSKAVGPGVQNDYINAVFALETQLCPENLLKLLQSLEREHGRQRTVRWGPRTLDLDLLIYGNEVINTTSLEVPHPRLHERNFVVYPLAELAPDWQLPSGDSVRNIRDRLSGEGLCPLLDSEPYERNSYE